MQALPPSLSNKYKNTIQYVKKDKKNQVAYVELMIKKKKKKCRFDNY